MSKGIKFRGNKKANLIPTIEGEVVYAADTFEWGLCVTAPNFELEFLWRSHGLKNHVFTGDASPLQDIGMVGDYYIDNSSSEIYQKKGQTLWEILKFPLPADGFNVFTTDPNSVDYSSTIRKDGSIQIDNSKYKSSKSIIPFGEIECRLPISNDASVKFCDHLVKDKFGTIYRGATVYLNAGVYRKINDLVYDDSVSYVRYHSVQSIGFNNGVTLTPDSDNHINIISNDEIYPTSNQTAITKVEVLMFGKRTSWHKISNGCIYADFIITAKDKCYVEDVSFAWVDSKMDEFPFFDSSNVINFSNAWRACDFHEFPLLDTSSGKNFSETWFHCSGLQSFPPLDVSAGTNFYKTWLSCWSLPHCPDGNEVNVPDQYKTANMC